MVNKLDFPRYVMVGDVADAQRSRAQTILRKEGVNPNAVFEFAPSRDCTVCGLSEVLHLLEEVLPEDDCRVWALEGGDGVQAQAGEVVLRVQTAANSLLMFQSAITGVLASASGWATAARECVEASGKVRVMVSGTSYLHPNLVAQMEYAAVKGGCVATSTPLGARLSDTNAHGTMTTLLIVLMGDAQSALTAMDRTMPPEVQRIARAGVLRDEVEDVMEAVKAVDNLSGIHLRTPPERGGVTVELVKEVRAHLVQSDNENVDIIVSGGFTPAKLAAFVEAGAPVDAFVVGHHVATASPISYSSEIKEMDGEPIARRGLAPGVTDNPRLEIVSLQSSNSD